MSALDSHSTPAQRDELMERAARLAQLRCEVTLFSDTSFAAVITSEAQMHQRLVEKNSNSHWWSSWLIGGHRHTD